MEVYREVIEQHEKTHGSRLLTEEESVLIKALRLRFLGLAACNTPCYGNPNESH
jgi:hypothetical protein